MVRKQSTWLSSLKQPGKLEVQDFSGKKYQFIKHSSRLRHVGPAVVPQFEIKRAERVPKTRFSPPLTLIFFCFLSACFVGLFSISIVYRFPSCRINSPFQRWLSFQVCSLCPWWEWQTFWADYLFLNCNRSMSLFYCSELIRKFGFCVIAKWVFTT